MSSIRITQENITAVTGVTEFVLNLVFNFCCGRGTPVEDMSTLVWTLNYLKAHPTTRITFTFLQTSDTRNTHRKIWRCVEYLATKLRPLVDSEWEHRAQCLVPPDVAELYGNHCIGYIDSFPIRVKRPRSQMWRRALQNKKYNAHVFKVQMITNHVGTPIWYTGPHAGVIHDKKLWDNYNPGLGPHCLLADKGYKGADPSDLCIPYVKPAGRDFDRFEEAWNRVHSWYRATVEHTFSQMKKFAILGEIYRGRMNASSMDRLGAALDVIVGLVIIQTTAHPLKDVSRSLVEDAVFGDLPPREVLHGLSIGRSTDQVIGDDGVARGLGPCPDSRSVNTRCTWNQFSAGDRILAWWWGLWWRGTISYKRIRDKTLDLKFDHEQVVTTHYSPRFIRPIA